MSGSLPKATPPSFTFGQEMLISMASISVSSKCFAISPYSSTLDPEILMIKLVSSLSSEGKISLITESVPGFCSPIAFSMPLGVSAILWALFPSRGARVVPFKQTAPTSELEKPLIRVYSSPNPTQPESKMIGEFKDIPQKLVLRLFCIDDIILLWRLLSQ